MISSGEMQRYLKRMAEYDRLGESIREYYGKLPEQKKLFDEGISDWHREAWKYPRESLKCPEGRLSTVFIEAMRKCFGMIVALSFTPEVGMEFYDRLYQAYPVVVNRWMGVQIAVDLLSGDWIHAGTTGVSGPRIEGALGVIRRDAIGVENAHLEVLQGALYGFPFVYEERKLMLFSAFV